MADPTNDREVALTLRGLRRAKGIARPPRLARLLSLLVAQLEPEAEAILLVHLPKELRLVEAHGQRLDRDPSMPPEALPGTIVSAEMKRPMAGS
jgi:hypothetical protein